MTVKPNSFLLVVASALALSLPACSTATKGTSTVQQIDTVTVAASPMGLDVQQAVRGAATVSLSDPGDAVTMRMGEKVSLIISDLNPDTEIIETVIDDERGTVTLSVRDIRDNIVTLVRKCQTIDRIGTSNLPSIRLAEGMSAEQIIITPMCDATKNVIGYSIRYGSTARGCKAEARAALRAFERCRENNNNGIKSRHQSDILDAVFNGRR